MSLFIKKQEPIPEQTAEQKESANFVEQFVQSGLRTRQFYERQWYLNMAFYLGFQWIRWNPITYRIETAPSPSYRVRLVSNQILPTVNRIIGKMTKNRPTLIAVPATSAEEDKNAAKFSNSLLEFLERHLKMQSLDIRLKMLTAIYGTAFEDPIWDITAGEEISERRMITQMITDETGNLTEQQIPAVDEQGNEIIDRFNIGEVAIEVVPPFGVIPQSGMCSISESTRVCKIKLRSLDWIKSNFKDGYMVKSETQKGLSSSEKQLYNLMGELNKAGGESIVNKKSGEDTGGFAVVKEFRELPSQDYPDGRLMIVANGILLFDKGLPFDFWKKRRKLGLIKYDFYEIPDRFWGFSPVEPLIPLQVEYNKTRSQIIEAKNLMSKPKWIVAKGQKINKNAITSEPGEIIEYSAVPGTNEPHPVNPPTIPNYVHKELELNLNDIQNISSQHEVSRGQTPPNISSGIAVQALQEQDDTPLGPTIDRFEQNKQELGMYILNIVKEKYIEPRKIIIVGKNKEIEVKDFMASDNMPVDVIVQQGSTAPQSKAAKQAFIIDLFRYGLFTPEDRKEVLRMLELGSISDIYDKVNSDYSRADLENRKIMQGQPIKVEIFDDHSVHIGVHDDFRKTQEHEKLPPQIKQILDMHVTEHIQRLQSKMMAGAQGGPQAPNAGMMPQQPQPAAQGG